MLAEVNQGEVNPLALGRDRSILLSVTVPAITQVSADIVYESPFAPAQEVQGTVFESISNQAATLVTRPRETRDEKAVLVRIANSGNYPHRRSFEFVEQGAPDFKLVSQNGTSYSGASIKGVNLENPRLRVHMYKGRRVFSIEGMMTEHEAFMEMNNSRALSGMGVSTESVVQISRPTILPIIDQDTIIYVSQADFVKRVVDAAKDRLDPKIISDAARSLEGIKFAAMTRLTPVPFRLSDLIVPFEHPTGDSQQQFTYMINYVFKYLNKIGLGTWDYLNPVNLSSPENRNKVHELFSFVARRLGIHLGIMHGKGITYEGPHGGNICAEGSVVDTASMVDYGPYPPEEERVLDLRVASNALYVFDDLEEYGVATENTGRQARREFFNQYAEFAHESLRQKVITAALKLRLRV